MLIRRNDAGDGDEGDDDGDDEDDGDGDCDIVLQIRSSGHN